MFDLRQAVRVFGREPGFTAVAIVALAIGIGSSTAMFSVVDTALLRRLPYTVPERLLKLTALEKRAGRPDGGGRALRARGARHHRRGHRRLLPASGNVRVGLWAEGVEGGQPQRACSPRWALLQRVAGRSSEAKTSPAASQWQSSATPSGAASSVLTQARWGAGSRWITRA